MGDLRLKARNYQILTDLRGHHNGAVLPSGAPERYRKITLSFTNIMWQQVHQQVRNTVDKFHGLGKGPDIACHSRVTPGQVLESRDVIRVREKPDVEYQIAICGNPVAKTEARHINHDVRFIAASPKPFPDKIAQLVYGEPGRVDDQVRDRPDGRELRPLGLNTTCDRPVGAERM